MRIVKDKKRNNKKSKEKITVTHGWLNALRGFWQTLVNIEGKGETEKTKKGKVVGLLGTGARYIYKVKILNLGKRKKLKNNNSRKYRNSTSEDF